MDEIPVWFDMVGNFTVSQKGEKTVQIRSTDNKKTRLTVVLMCHSLTGRTIFLILILQKFEILFSKYYGLSILSLIVTIFLDLWFRIYRFRFYGFRLFINFVKFLFFYFFLISTIH